MERSAFRQLLRRYKDGSATENEQLLVDQWYELLYNESTPVLNKAELDSVEQEMWDKIIAQGNFPAMQASQSIPIAKKPLKSIVLRWLAAAAIIAGVVFGIKGLNSSPKTSFSYEQYVHQDKLVEVVNNTLDTKKVILEDGTYVLLQPSSKIAYPRHFTIDKREVYMQGAAFFNVSKNAAKPFFVYNENLVTQVLGTSFSINNDAANKQVVVAVKTGKVTVYENIGQVALDDIQKKNNGAIITPNQKVIYHTKERYFISSLVEQPEPVIKEDTVIDLKPDFSFEDTPLFNVLQNIEDTYAIEIVIENEAINNCRFTGNISQLSLYDKLDIICQSINHSYEIKGTKILVKGKGCN
jgi:transmembrane sensor